MGYPSQGSYQPDYSANVTAIKAKTDMLPASPANEAGNVATVKTKIDQLDLPVAVASANLRNSNNVEKTTQSVVYIKVKEIVINSDMSGVRIKFDMKIDNVLGIATGRIYKNGVSIGTEQTDGTAVYQVFSEDLTGFVKGDMIQIFAKVDNAARTASVRNLQLFYDLSYALSVTSNDP